MRRNVNKLATLVMTGALAASMSFGAFADNATDKRINDSNNHVTIIKNVTTDTANKTKAPYTTFTLTVSEGPTTDVQLDTINGKKTFSVTKPTEAQIAAIQDTLVDANFKAAKETNEDGTDNNGYTYNSQTGVYSSQFKLDVPVSIFSAPGLYSFKLNETNSGYTGVKYDTADKIMYVSVINKIVDDKVVYDETTKKPILVVDSVVLAETDANGNVTKTQEITNDFGADNTNNDKTHDITITKEVTGNAGQRDKDFHINVSVNRKSGVSEDVASINQEFTLLDSTGAEVTTDGVLNATGAWKNVPLKSGESLKIQGLTEDYVVSVYEVEAGEAGYTSTYTITTPTEDGKTSTTAAATLGNKADNAASLTATLDKTVITITNHKDNVTPTGVAMDVAPYALMVALAGGAAVTFLRKKESFED